jgi:hypothetical protein
MALDASKRALATASHAPPSTRSYWVVPAWLLAGAYPSTPEGGPERVSALFGAGIRTFVSLVEEDERPWGKPFAPYAGDLDAIAGAASAAGNVRASCIRFPVPDGGIPSVSGMRSILDTIDLSLDAGRPAYVHCFGGMGRTATAVGCWLMRHGLASKSDVLEVIARLRQADDERRHRDAPENDEQRAFVKAWARGS